MYNPALPTSSHRMIPSHPVSNRFELLFVVINEMNANVTIGSNFRTSSKMKLVQAWLEIHNEELMADWELAIIGETIFKIDPLK